MSDVDNTCNHSSEILDESSGDYVCTMCGLVLDRFFGDLGHASENNETSIDTTYNSQYEFIAEILSKLNVPITLADSIFAKIVGNRLKDSAICQIIYDTLIERNIPFTLKEITSVSGVPTKKIKHTHTANPTSICIVEERDILERCCSKLGLTYKDCTVIKKSFANDMSGFSPSTVIASHIYIHCKKNRIKLKLKKISEIVGVSPISVHRYLRRK